MKNKVLRWIPTALLSVVAIMMLSSFVFRMFISPSVDPTVEGASACEFEQVIQVNVLNGCGVPKLAARAKTFLRERGFDVVEIGNFSEKIKKSAVFDRLGDIGSARKVAYAMGIGDSLVVSKIDSSENLRCTIVIGADYQTLKPFE